MTEDANFTYPVEPYRIQVSDAPWSWLYAFIAYVLIFAGIGGAVFLIDWAGSLS